MKVVLNWFKNNNSRTIALEKFLKIVLELFKNFQENCLLNCLRMVFKDISRISVLTNLSNLTFLKMYLNCS